MDTYDAYLFDLDGTLVDTAPDLMAGLNVCLVEHGYTAVDEELTRRWVGHGAAKMIEQALVHQGGEGPPTHLAKSMLDQFLDYYVAHIADESTPYPGVREALTSLGPRARLGVVTNKVTRLTTALLDALDLSRCFEVVVCGDTLGVYKPRRRSRAARLCVPGRGSCANTVRRRFDHGRAVRQGGGLRRGLRSIRL